MAIPPIHNLPRLQLFPNAIHSQISCLKPNNMACNIRNHFPSVFSSRLLEDPHKCQQAFFKWNMATCLRAIGSIIKPGRPAHSCAAVICNELQIPNVDFSAKSIHGLRIESQHLWFINAGRKIHFFRSPGMITSRPSPRWMLSIYPFRQIKRFTECQCSTQMIFFQNIRSLPKQLKILFRPLRIQHILQPIRDDNLKQACQQHSPIRIWISRMFIPILMILWNFTNVYIASTQFRCTFSFPFKLLQRLRRIGSFMKELNQQFLFHSRFPQPICSQFNVSINSSRAIDWPYGCALIGIFR